MKIEQLRKEKKLSQDSLSKILNIERRTLSNYESNELNTKLKNLIKIADYFNVSLDYLCERQFNNQIGYIPEDKKELVKMILELDASDINEISALIRGYKAGKSGSTNFKVFN